jgi:hypothetical protein
MGFVLENKLYLQWLSAIDAGLNWRLQAANERPTSSSLA